MKKFEIIEIRPATYSWTHIVYAKSAEEAIDKVKNAESEITYSEVEEHGVECSNYEVFEIVTPFTEEDLAYLNKTL
jgi:hypothetical protein